MKLTDANRPMRVLDKVLHGGLGAGNLGVIMARHGTGKLAVLTSIAIDHAMDSRNTLHVALGQTLSDIRAYHDEVLHGIAGSLDLNNNELQTLVERHKQIYNFRDGQFNLARLRETLDFLRDGCEFVPELIEFQGWPDFEKLDPNEMEQLKAVAKEYNCEMWLAAHTHRTDTVSDAGLPDFIARQQDQLSAVVSLEPEAEHVRIHVLKANDAAAAEQIHLEFDPQSMLIRWR
ncbi:MAG: hypothetical protein AAF581_19275 [Planctomycetota bacterium]